MAREDERLEEAGSRLSSELEVATANNGLAKVEVGLSTKPSQMLSLFPAVPKPRSAASIQRAGLYSAAAKKATTKRSTSLEDTHRPSTSGSTATGKHALPSIDTAHRRRQSSLNGRTPMSTLHESLDSPTVPLHFARPATATGYSDDGGYGRPGSALGEYEGSVLSGTQDRVPAWASRHATASSKTLHGLGLTWPAPGIPVSARPSSPLSHRGPSPGPMKGTHLPRERPALRVSVPGEERPAERPPPPPPKSPRHHTHTVSSHSQATSEHSRTHSRDPSLQSRLSSRASSSRPPSPIAVAQPVSFSFVKPTFVHHATHSSGSVPRDGSIRSASTADTRTTDGSYAHESDRGRPAIKAFVQKSAPQLPQFAPSDTGSSGFSSLLSKFNIGAARNQTKNESELTPRPQQEPSFGKLEAASQSTAPVNSHDHSSLHVMDNRRSPSAPRKETLVTRKAVPAVNAPERTFGQEQESALDSTGIDSRIQAGTSSSFESRKDSRNEYRTPSRGESRDEDSRGERKQESRLESRPESRGERRPESRNDNRNESRNRGSHLPLAPVHEAPPTPRPLPEPSLTKQTSSASHARAILANPPSRSSTPDLVPRDPVSKLRTDRPTPELPFRSATPDISSIPIPEDPHETLRNLAVQTEALHARYSTLRSDRQKLSMSIVANLREQRAGPEYVTTMLDQHLALAATNSSMDICFAKLKSLDCRKEEAMSVLLAQMETRRKMRPRSRNSPRSVNSEHSSTPEVGSERSASRLSGDSRRPRSNVGSETGLQAEDATPKIAQEREAQRPAFREVPATDPDTRTKNDSPSHPLDTKPQAQKTTPSQQLVKPVAVSIMIRRATPKPSTANQKPPAGLWMNTCTKATAPPSLDLHHPSASTTPDLRISLPLRSPAPTSPLPRPPTAIPDPPPPPAGSRVERRTSHFRDASSSADETEIATPLEDRAGKGVVGGGEAGTEISSPEKVASLGVQQGVQVVVEDDLLDYYYYGDEKD
ncbi:hypothetical protein LTR62_004469 [Meristemomyces frigidus]|uniref:Uncharacterized protein n=1 Tax=Meristemomyces frigidus TaxID=1508187 RepID=A0AAN7YG65_9PEZI|nr:hypothetical protein LTR62_004469 [Meristemomyces frigidus]